MQLNVNTVYKNSFTADVPNLQITFIFKLIHVSVRDFDVVA